MKSAGSDPSRTPTSPFPVYQRSSYPKFSFVSLSAASRTAPKPGGSYEISQHMVTHASLMGLSDSAKSASIGTKLRLTPHSSGSGALQGQ